jgi:hypothetical protein
MGEGRVEWVRPIREGVDSHPEMSPRGSVLNDAVPAWAVLIDMTGDVRADNRFGDTSWTRLGRSAEPGTLRCRPYPNHAFAGGPAPSPHAACVTAHRSWLPPATRKGCRHRPRVGPFPDTTRATPIGGVAPRSLLCPTSSLLTPLSSQFGVFLPFRCAL